MKQENWYRILQELECTEANWGIDSFEEGEFMKIEENLNFTFPDEYKKICKTWGNISFGGFFEIIGPSVQYNNDSKKILKSRLKEELEEGSVTEEEYGRECDRIKELFIFGHSSQGEYVAWDTSEESRKTAGKSIYLYYCDEVFPPINLGNNFSKFVLEFCLGELPFSILPEYRWPDKELNRSRLFQFKLTETNFF